MVNPILLPELREMLAADDSTGLREFCEALHPATVAEFIEGLSVDETWLVLAQADLSRQAEIFEFLPLPKQIEMVSAVQRPRMARLLEAMSPDERADLLAKVDGEVVEALLPLVAQAERTDIRRLLSYPEDSAGAVMTTEYASLTEDLTAEEAIGALRRQAPDRETIYYVYVLDAERHLHGFISLQQLIVAPKSARVRDLMQRDVISVRVNDDKEHVAHQLARYDFLAIPVVDDVGRLVGIVTHDDVLDVLQEEASEDALQMGGVMPLEEGYLQTPLMVFARKRGTWLLILFVASTLTAVTLSYFQKEFAQIHWLVMFIPLILSCGGNSGSQSATLVIRALAVGNVTLQDWWKIAWRELAMGCVLGVTLALFCVGLAVALSKGDYRVFLVPLTLMIVVILGTLVGSLLPLLFKRLGLDPAITSTPFVASLTDVFGILAYSTLAQLLLLM
jgi:magnesium transporter